MNFPADFKYAETHEWLRIEGDEATVGITDHAQAELTDIVYVDLPQLGRQVGPGEAFAVVESVKAASDIYAPVLGEVIAVNEELVANPALVNTDPHGAGWLCRLRLAPDADTSHLLDAEAYAGRLAGH